MALRTRTDSPRAPADAFVAPSRARVLRVRDRLRAIYGVPLMAPHGHPIAELILTVLSQSTNDRNRDIAYLRMRERFPTWEAVRDAPVTELEEAIRPGGISRVKSARTQRRPLSSPAFETKNGTMKLSAQRTHVAVVEWPAAITPPWLIAVSRTPTTMAIRSVRRRLRGRRQNAHASRTTASRALSAPDVRTTPPTSGSATRRPRRGRSQRGT